MAVTCYLLILLIQALSLLGATEYYVRPTEPTNTSCPAQPCLTLNQYTNDSDQYFKSNTVFKFLPGTHHMNRPVIIGNVHNMSLESLSDESPHLVAQFPCDTQVRNCIPVIGIIGNGYASKPPEVCCSAFLLHDTYNVSVKGISLTMQTSNVLISGILFKNASGITVQWTTTCSFTDYLSIGIAIYKATSVKVHSSSAYNCSVGFLLHKTTNTHITNVTTLHNDVMGVYLYVTTDTYVTNTTTAENGIYGMYSLYTNNTHIINTTAAQNEYGMVLLYMNNTHITNSTATHNYWHGMHLLAMNNTFITDTIAAHNRVKGMSLYYMFTTHITSTTAVHNGEEGINLYNMFMTYITNTTAAHNGGAGMYLYTMNDTQITEVTVTHNVHNIKGAAAREGQIVLFFATYTRFYNTSFTDTYALDTVNPTDPTTLPAVIVLFLSALQFSECHFARNNISAIRAHASNVTLSGSLTFSSNRAFAGAAFILLQKSTIHFEKNSHTSFLNNYATNTGGVFYIANYEPILNADPHNHGNNYMQLSSYTCFLNTKGSRSQIRFTFVKNSAGKGGDILYGGHVGLALDGNWNCLDSFKNISNISQSSLSSVASDPSRICLCNRNGQPDCLIVADPSPHSIYPGQTINISTVLVGQDFGTVSGSVYAQFLQRGETVWLGPGQNVQGVIQHNCNHLSYTVFAQREVSEAVLILTAHDSYISSIIKKETDVMNMWKYRYKTSRIEPLMHIDNPVYVNISLLPCPPGFMLTTDQPFKCDCDLLLQRINGFHCHIQEQAIGRSGLLWVGMIGGANGTNGTLAASEFCSLDYCKREEINVTLSEFDSQCNYNHSGTLCGGCQPGFSLTLGSTQCLQCSNKYLALLVPLAMAGPTLVFSIKLLDLTISQGTLNGIIFYANIVKANEYIFLPQGQTNPLTVFISWLNLDLGVETCLFHGLTAYSKTWLQFVFPLYIWSIAGLIIILARYSDRVANLGNNSVPVLATLFLLSYAKLIRTIVTALSYTIVYTSHGPKAVWTADGNVDYLGPKHAPLFAAAVAVLLFLWLPYTLLLFLGQWLHRCKCRLICHILTKMKPFLDAHYGSLKGKHRYWFGALLLVRAAVLLISALVPSNHSNSVVLCISVCAVVLTLFGQMVYHNLMVSVFDTFFFTNLAILGAANSFATIAKRDPAVSAYTLIGVALVQFAGLVLIKVFFIFQKSKRARECFHKSQDVEDDWELYEQAAALREMESDAEEHDSDGSGSIESLPTY